MSRDQDVIFEITSLYARIVALFKSFFQCAWRMCWLRWAAWVVKHLQWSHLNNFSPRWVRMCILRLPAWVQEKPHCEQLKSFSPEWLSNCFFEMRRYCGGVTALFTTERIYSQMKQMWLLRFWAFIVEYLHCVQAKGFSSLWPTYVFSNG